MSYCRIHGHFGDFHEGCPTCRDTEEDIKTSLSEIAHASANPGDYECPHCRYISLKWGASRCPLCHGDLRGDHWKNILAAEEASANWEKARKEAQAAERKRTEPARNAAATKRFAFFFCYMLIVWGAGFVFILAHNNKFGPGFIALAFALIMTPCCDFVGKHFFNIPPEE
jgi:hypothetical protein